MNARIPAQELHRVVSTRFGLELGALDHLQARCNDALPARFSTQEEWNVFYRESLGKLKAFCSKDGTLSRCEEAIRAEGPRRATADAGRPTLDRQSTRAT